MKKIFCTILIIMMLLLNINTIALADDKSIKQENSDIFSLYTERVDRVCSLYDDARKVINIEKFKPIEKYGATQWEFESQEITQSIIQKYEDDMNNIYKCSLVHVQKNALNRIKDLIKKNTFIKRWIEAKINNNLSILDEMSSQMKCLNTTNDQALKLVVLRQTTYLTCDYSFYMNYLSEYFDNPANIISFEGDEWIPIVDAANLITTRKNQLLDAVDHANKMYSLAFNAYSEYENNILAHFLLELLKEDFIVFRQKLHEVLNPLNQTIYKIPNAMKIK